MSHSAKSDESTCEPNLTALLDLILQILMFFMITTQLSAERARGGVDLPDSDTAQPLPPGGRREEDLFIGLIVNKKTKDHAILFPGRSKPVPDRPGRKEPFPPMKQDDARLWIKNFYELYKDPNHPVIIRADSRADYAEVFKLLRACADAGFRNIKVRAWIPG